MTLLLGTSTHEFLDSDLTKTMIGRNDNRILKKFRTLLDRAKGDPSKTTQKIAWNWPAFFLPYAWLFYRKLYLLGGIVFAIQLAYAALPETWVSEEVYRMLSFGTLGMGIAVAMFGHSWYFDALYKRWAALRGLNETERTQRLAEAATGTNLPLALGALALIVLVAFYPIIRDGF